MGKPTEDIIDDFDVYEVNGFTVRVRCDVVTKDDVIEVGYSKFLFKEMLTVSGVMV